MELHLALLLRWVFVCGEIGFQVCGSVFGHEGLHWSCLPNRSHWLLLHGLLLGKVLVKIIQSWFLNVRGVRLDLRLLLHGVEVLVEFNVRLLGLVAVRVAALRVRVLLLVRNGRGCLAGLELEHTQVTEVLSKLLRVVVALSLRLFNLLACALKSLLALLDLHPDFAVLLADLLQKLTVALINLV